MEVEEYFISYYVNDYNYAVQNQFGNRPPEINAIEDLKTAL